MTDFNKPAGRAASLVDQWIERGLDVPDRARAEHYISVVSYYRLSAYTLPFQCGNPEHHFNHGEFLRGFRPLYLRSPTPPASP